MSVRIVLADDHNLVRDGIKAIIAQDQNMQVVGEADNGRDAVELVRQHHPDIVILDITMPRLNGIDSAVEIKKNHPQVKIITLTMHSDKQFVKKMLEIGASGYILKSSASQDLLTAINMVMSGNIYLSQQIINSMITDFVGPGGKKDIVNTALTSRERETLQMIAEGKSTKEIASEMNVSVKSVDVYRKQLMEKLGCQTMAELIKYAIREGITPL